MNALAGLGSGFVCGYLCGLWALAPKIANALFALAEMEHKALVLCALGALSLLFLLLIALPASLVASADRTYRTDSRLSPPGRPSLKPSHVSKNSFAFDWLSSTGRKLS